MVRTRIHSGLIGRVKAMTLGNTLDYFLHLKALPYHCLCLCGKDDTTEPPRHYHLPDVLRLDVQTADVEALERIPGHRHSDGLPYSA